MSKVLIGDLLVRWNRFSLLFLGSWVATQFDLRPKFPGCFSCLIESDVFEPTDLVLALDATFVGVTERVSFPSGSAAFQYKAAYCRIPVIELLFALWAVCKLHERSI
jgi:hypothetical protein